MILETFLVLTVIVSIIAVFRRDLYHATLLLSISDLTLAVVFFILAAPDIAITQASVVAGLSLLIFSIAIKKTERMEK